jgi:K319-like protein
LEFRKITILFVIGGLITAVWASIETNGYPQVPPIQSQFTQKQASKNNDSTTPFSLPSIRLDNPGNATTVKSGLVAIAGPDQIVKEGATVILNGSRSRDSNGVILAYSWKQIPTNNFITLSGASTPIWSFTAPTVSADTTLKFQLTVTDSNGLNGSSTVNVLVKNIPEQTPSTANSPASNAIPSNNPPASNAIPSNNPPIADIVPQQTPSTANSPASNATPSNNPPIAGIIPQQTPSTVDTS